MSNSANAPKSLREQQYQFAAHLRDPDNKPAPSAIEDRRMAIYRNLFINNVTAFLKQSFPITSATMGDERWKMLIRDYYRDHRSHSPLFPDMPKEFLEYLAAERAHGRRTDEQDDPPFLYELAHYEWAETGLALASEPEPDPALNPEGDLLADYPVVSSLTWLLSYNYPVNEIGVTHQPEEPAPQALLFLLYRNSEHKVRFLKLNTVSARLFELLDTSQPLTGRDALERIAAELQHSDPAAVVRSGEAIMTEWRGRGILLGTLATTR